MALVGYSSSEDEDGCEDKEGSILPSFTCDVESDGVRFAESGRISCSDGRVRGFAHKHGNWATCVFFPASASLNLFFNTLLNNVNTILSQCEQQFYTCDDFHLSVTKTWPILHHWIVGFTEAVRGIAANHQRPCITLGEAGFLVNEERTRSFLVVGVKESGSLNRIVSDLDPIVASYRGGPYYKDRIFHFSLSWCLGDVENIVSPNWKKTCLASIDNFISSHASLEGFELANLVLKIGGDKYQLPLL